MSSIDAYGDFDLPEETTEIEVIEDPTKVINGYYEIFTKICEKTNKEIRTGTYYWEDDVRFAEEVYNQMCNFFDGKQLNVNQDAVLEYLRTKAKPKDHSGIFLSSLQNNSNLDELILTDFPKVSSSYPKDFETIKRIGYRLKPNKILVLEEDIRAEHAGDYSEGTIINKGIVGWLGNSTKKGVIINKGKVKGSFADYCKDGIQINEEYCQYMAREPKDGIQINNGIIGINQRTLSNILIFLSGGFLIGTYPYKWGLLGFLSKGGIQINNGIVHGKNNDLSGLGQDIDLNSSYFKRIRKKIFSPKKYKLEKELQNKLKKLNFLKINNTEELIKQVKVFDWKLFEFEIKELAEQIK